jgi:hypothetical protein
MSSRSRPNVPIRRKSGLTSAVRPPRSRSGTYPDGMADPKITWWRHTRSWIGRSLKETARSGHSAALLTSLSVLVLGSFLNWYRLRHPSHGKPQQVNLWGAVWPSLIIAGVVLVGFFIFHLATTPSRLAAEQEKSYAADLAAAKARQEEAEAALAAVREERLSDSHTADLKEIIRQVAMSIESQRPCGFADTTDRDVLMSHFPQLTDQIEAWDHAIGLVYNASATLKAVLQEEVDSHNLTEPLYHHDNLVDVLFSSLMIVAAQPYVGSFTPLRWAGYQNWAQLGSVRVITFHDLAEASKEKFAEAIAPVDALWADAHNWPATQDYANRDADSGWEAIKAPLLMDLEGLLKRDHFKKGDGCERCS